MAILTSMPGEGWRRSPTGYLRTADVGRDGRKTGRRSMVTAHPLISFVRAFLNRTKGSPRSDEPAR
jgi:hypothetical protein